MSAPPGEVLVDFDGDGCVAEWEEQAIALWRSDPSLSLVLAAAIESSPVSESGVVDISEYLRSLTPTCVPPAEEESSSDDELPGATPDGPAPPPTPPAWSCQFKRGDVDRDADVDITDYYRLSYYLSGTYFPANLDAADVNDDGAVDGDDQLYILQYLYSAGPQPPPPFSYFALDPTYDLIELPCQDQGDFEHARNRLEEKEIALPPAENPSLPSEMLPEGATEPVDGTGGFGGLAPDLPVFAGPGNLRWGYVPSYRTRFVLRNVDSTTFQFQSENGANWFSGIPHIVDAGPTASPRYWIRWSASCVRAYTLDGYPLYNGRFLNQTKLVNGGSSNELWLYDLAGRRYVFHSYEGYAKAVKGRIKRIEGLGGSGGAKIRVEFNWGDLTTGRLEAVRVVSETGAACQTWSFTYGTGASLYRITEATMTRPDGTAPYRLTFRYFDPSVGEPGGTAGDLMQVDVEKALSPVEVLDPADAAIVKTYYYRYFIGSTWSADDPGYQHQVRFFCGPDACTYLNPATYRTLPNYNPQGADLSSVAEREYEYCQDRRARTLRLKGLCCGSGVGAYSYEWFLGKTQALGIASESHLKVEIALPRDESVFDSRRILCFNPYGQKLVDARCVKETELSAEVRWVSAATYGTTSPENWHLRHRFWPSACGSFDPDAGTSLVCGSCGQSPQFTGNGDLDAYTPSGDQGKHLEYTYAYETAAVEVGTGLGEGAAATNPVSRDRYTILVDLSNGYRRRAVPAWSQFYESDGTPRQIAWTYSSQCAEDSLIFQEVQKTAPAVTTGKNGSGVVVSERFWYDSRNMPVWHKDGAGRVTYTAYDAAFDQEHPTPVTWLVSIRVEDINTSLPPSDVELPDSIPSSFQTSGADRINAATFFAYDGLCRTTKVDAPAGLADDNATLRRRVGYFVHAKLSGDSEQLSSDKAVTLAYPHVEGTLPIGEVDISVRTPGGRAAASAKALLLGGGTPDFYGADWVWDAPPQTLEGVFPPTGDRHLLERREYAYAFDEDDGYRIVTETVWTDPESADPGGDYTTEQHYNNQGQLARIVGKKTDGTLGFRQIVRVRFDAVGREREVLLGSNDNGETNPPGSPAGPNDMVVVRHSYYDGGWNGSPELVAGDGHLTRTALFPGDGSQRLTHNQHDWRGRRMRTWEGYDAGTGTWKQITATEFDNQNRDTGAKVFADLALVDLEIALDPGKLRAYVEKAYDEVGRVYRTAVHGVNPETGAVDEGAIPLTTDFWHGARGELVKRRDPDGTFVKRTYDGLGREVATFKSYDNNTATEGTYAQAADVTGDVVVEQVFRTRDQAGNVLTTASFARFQTATALGELTAANARRSYECRWFDVLGRPELDAFFGDNGGGALPAPRPSRPGPLEVTDGARMLTRYAYWAALNASHRRWACTTAVDGQVHGAEIDALGRTVRAWVGGRLSSTDFQVVDRQYDALDHVTAETRYQGYGYASSTEMPPNLGDMSGASATTTGYSWGVERLGTENLAAQTGVLAAVYRPDATTGLPSTLAAMVYTYNALGEQIASTQTRAQDETFHKHVTRDVLGRTLRESVEDDENTEMGPWALEWDYDSLGRVVKARSRDADEWILNEVAYVYDAWGAVTEFTQEHEGAVTGTSPRASYGYQGPMLVGSSGTLHPILHRPVTLNLYAGADLVLGMSYNYGAAGATPDMLTRPEYHEFCRYLPTSGNHRVYEYYMGASTWVKSESRKQEGPWKLKLTEEITDPALASPSGGFDRFGRPVNFKTWKGVSGSTYWPLRRSLTYDPQTTQLLGINDFKGDNGVETEMADDDYTSYDAFGRVTGHQHRHKTWNGLDWVWPQEPDTRSWIFDGAANETCNSKDTGTECTAPSREFDLRNEIEEMEGDPEAEVLYDEAGRLLHLKHVQHNIDVYYFYDAWNRLAGYGDSPEAVDVVFEYDAMGRLITQGPSKHLYYDAQGNVAWVAALPAGADSINVWSIYSGRLLAILQGTATNWHVPDARGRPALTTDLAGTPKERYWGTPDGNNDPPAAGGAGGGGLGGGIGGFPAASTAADCDSGMPVAWVSFGYEPQFLPVWTGGQFVDTGAGIMGGAGGQWWSTVLGDWLDPFFPRELPPLERDPHRHLEKALPKPPGFCIYVPVFDPDVLRSCFERCTLDATMALFQCVKSGLSAHGLSNADRANVTTECMTEFFGDVYACVPECEAEAIVGWRWVCDKTAALQPSIPGFVMTVAVARAIMSAAEAVAELFAGDATGDGSEAMGEGDAVSDGSGGQSVSARTSVGRMGGPPIEVAPGTNQPTVINGRTYTGHALDRMQARGLTPTPVENAIATGTRTAGSAPGTTVCSGDGVTVVINRAGDVVTAW